MQRTPVYSFANHHCRRCSFMTLLGKRYLLTTSPSLCVPSCVSARCCCPCVCPPPPPPPPQWEHPSVVVVVYDVTNEQSFKSCAKWLERVRAQKPEQPFPGAFGQPCWPLPLVHPPVGPAPLQVYWSLTRRTSLHAEWWERLQEGALQQTRDCSTLSALR